MLLTGQNAVIFAASGAIASQVARRLAGEGATIAPAELGYPTSSLDQNLDAFLLPIETIVGSQFPSSLRTDWR